MTTTDDLNSRNADLTMLLSEFDPFNDSHFARMPEVMDYARRQCPVAHSHAHGGLHLVTRYADVKAVLSDPETFSSHEASPLPTGGMALPPFTVDPPWHNQFRKVINRFFTRPYLRRHEDIMREIARSHIERFADRGEVGFIGEFAAPITCATVAEIVFEEVDEQRLKRITAAVERLVYEGTPEAYQGVAMIAAEYMAERAPTAAERDDLLSAIVTGTVDGRPMTQEEQLGMVTILFIASLDTTRGAIGNIAAAVATNPELEARLRNPDWIRDDFEEFLRWQSPVIALRRLVTKGVEFGGVQLHEDDIVMLMFGSANRDKTEFPDADHLNFDEHHRQHLAFGFGTHRCLGSTLAQTQVAIAFDELFKRVTNLRLAGPDPGPDYHAGAVLTPLKLRLAFDRADIRHPPRHEGVT